MTTETDKSQLLDAAFVARLDRLDVLSRKLLAGKLKGTRRGRRRGHSAEFVGYRNYTVGDDLRFIDWNVYARLDRLFLKLLLEEEDLTLHVLVDVSGSCDYGQPNKLLYMKKVAAALGYVGLVNCHHVNIVAMDKAVVAETGILRGRTRVAQMIDFISRLKPAGTSHLADACRRFALAHRTGGVCVLLSDFFDKNGYEAGLRYLAGGKYDLFGVQVLSPQEINPELQGDLKLRDMEDGELNDVSVTPAMLEGYKANLDAYCSALRNYLIGRGGSYLFTSTAVPFDTLVLSYLRERGLLG